MQFLKRPCRICPLDTPRSMRTILMSAAWPSQLGASQTSSSNPPDSPGAITSMPLASIVHVHCPIVPSAMGPGVGSAGSVASSAGCTCGSAGLANAAAGTRLVTSASAKAHAASLRRISMDCLLIMADLPELGTHLFTMYLPDRMVPATAPPPQGFSGLKAASGVPTSICGAHTERRQKTSPLC